MTHVQHADLRGVDLRHADLKGVDMSGAEFDRSTLFPIGFDPFVHKMVQVSLAANES